MLIEKVRVLSTETIGINISAETYLMLLPNHKSQGSIKCPASSMVRITGVGVLSVFA